MAMGDETEKGEGGPRPVLELVPSDLKPPSAQKRWLLELPLSQMLTTPSFISTRCCAKPACRIATREMRRAFGRAETAM
jgi:hypothetical protein